MIELAHDHIPVCSSDFYIESPIPSDKSMEMMLKDETYYLPETRGIHYEH